jgi:hypothetical protein
LALATYTDLQASVASWLNRNDTNIPITDFIDLAEADLNSRVRVRQNMTTATLSLTVGTSSVALPADLLEEIELNYSSGDELNRASFNDLDFAAATGESGKPNQYAIAGTTIQFNCAANETFSLLLRYYEAWDVATDGTNWLLLNHPDAYLFGALYEANSWLGDAGQAEMCRGRRDGAVIRAMMADSRTRGGVLRVDDALVGGGSYNINTD